MQSMSSLMPSPAEAIFFIFLTTWIAFALWGLRRTIPLYTRWHIRLQQMRKWRINGERQIRVKSLRRRAGIYSVIEGLFALSGIVRVMAEPGFITSLLISLSIVVAAGLIVADLELEARDIAKIEKLGYNRRITDLPTDDTLPPDDPPHA